VTDTVHVDEGNALLNDGRLTAAGLLFEVSWGLLDRLEPQIGEHGLGRSEFEALLRLARSPEGRLRMTDLAAQTNLSASGLTRLVDRLQARGLVTRQADATDGRGLLAEVTTPGRALVLEVLPGHLDLIQQWYVDALSPEQLAALTDALRAVRSRVRPGAEAGLGDAAPPAG
jgi:MarR family 2-MHQ and catechol resistance regulon transcriptional repressor